MDRESTALPDSQPDHAAAVVTELGPGNLEAGMPAEAPDSSSTEQESDEPDDAPETADRASRPVRRSLKLVLTLAPIDDAGFRCLLTVGADKCDPLLRSLEVSDVGAALQEAASLVVSAEERWQSQPRNPASTKKVGGASAKRSSAKQQSPGEGSQEPVTPAPNSDSAQPGQLPLFG